MGSFGRTFTLAFALLVAFPSFGRAQDKKDKPIPICDPKIQQPVDQPVDAPAEPGDGAQGDENDKDKQKEKCIDPAEALYRQIQRERMEKEKGPSKSRFFEKVHVDALWIPGQTDAKFLGVVGAHVTVIEMGRVHLFGPPGVMVLRSEGRIRTALTWGFSVYMTQFRLPGSNTQLALFGDFARAWTFGDYRTGTDLIGMSVAWRR